MVVPVAAWAFRANDNWHLVYELHIANIGSVECTLTQVDVVADATNARLARFSAADLNRIVVQPNVAVESAAKLPPAGFAVVYMWVTIHRKEDIPDASLM